MASVQRPLVTWIVVLGDFGRSPRMQYHAQSLASKPASNVHVVAYDGAKPLSSLASASNVHIHHLPGVPKVILRLPGILRLMLKVLHQLFVMLWLLLVVLPAPSNILMQNPPCIPTMILCWLAAKRHGASLVIDWHNFGHSIMALNRPPSSLIVRMAKSHEAAWGRLGSKHFCVTRAMQQELAGPDWRVSATVLYDRPPKHFRKTDASTAHELLVRISASISGVMETPMMVDFAADEAPEWGPSKTIATSVDSIGHGAAWRSERPAILVSSTSWTPDEDFGVLLEALILYEALVEGQKTGDSYGRKGQQRGPEKGVTSGLILPPLLVLITGRGPQREMYLKRIRELHMRHVAVRSLWLEAVDYPILLGAADLGVSLHASSSGLDLPMKVVDMFGAGLPVCALAYNCIGELIEAGETGLLFDGPTKLCDQLQELLQGFPLTPSKKLVHMQQQVAKREQGLRWEGNWDTVAWPLLKNK